LHFSLDSCVLTELYPTIHRNTHGSFIRWLQIPMLKRLRDRFPTDTCFFLLPFVLHIFLIPPPTLTIHTTLVDSPSSLSFAHLHCTKRSFCSHSMSETLRNFLRRTFPASSPHMSEHSPSSSSSWLGLAPHIRPLQVIASLSTATFSISFLVFISAATPFVLSSLLHVPQRKLGDITGSLILADELTALALYLPIGVLSDRIGVRWVAGTGYAVVAVALVIYVQAVRVWELVLARILFAVSFPLLPFSLFF